jgi:hypothetical protein
MRTNPFKVRELGGISESTNVDSYIEIAHQITNDLVECSKIRDEHRLELIERNLACHFAYISGVATAASITSKSIGGASTSYGRPQASTGVSSSPYSTTAIQLDSTMCLAGILNGPVKLTWLGK